MTFRRSLLLALSSLALTFTVIAAPAAVSTFGQFEGDAFEPLLLPVYTEPVFGAFGSVFRTDFRATLKGDAEASLYGFTMFCRTLGCLVEPETEVRLTPSNPEIFTDQDDVIATGTPGAFLYVPKSEVNRVAMQLRVYDTSRSAENFGTEVPVVRGSEFTEGFDEAITLIGIPSDPRFRNTLRIYARGEFGANVTIDIDGEAGFHATHTMWIEGGTLFTPGYLQFANFPVDAGTLRVTIRQAVPPISALLPPPGLWAFVSVTNNETQHITTVTPQP